MDRGPDSARHTEKERKNNKGQCSSCEFHFTLIWPSAKTLFHPPFSSLSTRLSQNTHVTFLKWSFYATEDGDGV